MANICIFSDNSLPDGGTYSGGSWSASLPLTNLQNQQPKRVARSTNALAASTQFTLDQGRTAPVSIVALINHNISTLGTARIRVSDNADGSSATLDVTLNVGDPNVVWGSLPWGAFPWDGHLSENQPGGSILFYKSATAVYGRYILVNISDTSNSAGYVQCGRFLAGVPFIPTYNYSYGAGLGMVDDSKLSRAIDGSLYADARPKRRSVSCSFGWLSEAEAIGAIYSMELRVGVTGGILIIENPDDVQGTAAARTIYGTLTSLQPITAQNESVDVPYSYQLSMEELV